MYYKIVTEKLQSLGLRGNPNIMTYVIGEWIFELCPKKGHSDDGGMWVTRTLGGARNLQKYMKNKHGVMARIFKCKIGEILFQNTYRIKTDKVLLLEEINKFI